MIHFQILIYISTNPFCGLLLGWGYIFVGLLVGHSGLLSELLRDVSEFHYMDRDGQSGLCLVPAGKQTHDGRFLKLVLVPAQTLCHPVTEVLCHILNVFLLQDIVIIMYPFI